MGKETLTTRAEQQLSMFYRQYFRLSQEYHFLLVLTCAYFSLATCGPCSVKNHLLSQGIGLYNPLVYDACGSSGHSYVAGLQDLFLGDISLAYNQGSTPTRLDLVNVCQKPELFCFPSTLGGIWSEEHKLNENVSGASESQYDTKLSRGSVLDGMQESNISRLSDYGKFKLLNGQTASCSLKFGEGFHGVFSHQNNFVDQNSLSSCQGPSPKQHGLSYISSKNSEITRSGLLDGSSSQNVQISSHLLDWGQQYLYAPSLAFLKVENTHNDNVLHVYEPFSTDTQFYPCDFDEILLGPGEVASICFAFLPRRLGLSSAQLVLQTSSGGYLVYAKGFAIESPYGMKPLVGLDMSSSGRWSKNLSLFNPFNDTLNVEEVTAWISLSSGNASHFAEALCRTGSFQDFDGLFSLIDVKERLDIMNGNVGLPLMGLRPHRNWKLDPFSNETIMEIDFSSDFGGRVYGAFCMQLHSSLQNRSDTVIIPLEAQLHGKAAYSGLSGLVSLSLEALMPCDDSETVFVALSLTNGAAYPLSVLKISEVVQGEKLFQIKYMEGLLLFPGTVTQIAVISYKVLSVASQDHPPETPNVNSNCKLHILTNDSGSQIEIPCQDVVQHCSKWQLDSSIGHEPPPEKGKSGKRTGTFGSGEQSLPQNKLKVLWAADADERVLRNWKSQGITSVMSVLDDHEILFPMVQVGSHYSKWVSVKNPSQHPVIMQLLINSGAIIDLCRPVDEFLNSSYGRLVQNELTKMTGHGFSVSETAITEIYVHPYGRAVLGPIIFHPSSRCGWRSSALIRNNLSGVEWLPLQGFGGTTSLVLLEGSAPVQSIEFNLNMPSPLNVSPSYFLFNMEDAITACSQPLSKEIYAKNVGDLPLEVRRIEVSGTDCGLDGFNIHSCKGFSLEPGESMRLLISYQTDFSTAVLHRDLELALATGIIVVPMKASLPSHMLTVCKKSLFLMRLKKISLVVIVAACVMFLFLYCIHPQPVALGTQYYLFEGERGYIATIRKAGKHFRLRLNQGCDSFSVSTNMDNMINSSADNEKPKLAFVGRYCDSPSGVQKQRITQLHSGIQDNKEQNIGISNPQKEIALLPSSAASGSGRDVQRCGKPETPGNGNLTIKISKRQERRRRKKKSGGTALTAILDVSSSQSGNSTPSSPLSPVTSSMPKQMWPPSLDVNHMTEARSPFAQARGEKCNKLQDLKSASEARLLEHEVSEENPSAPRKRTSKAVLLPSATFPCMGHRVTGLVNPSPFLASTSTIAPHERAPGSKLCNQKSVKTEDKLGLEDEFTYDIWGNHLSGLHLMGRTKEFSAMISNESEGHSVISNASEGHSESFFVRGPQTLMQKPKAKSVSPSYLPYSAVSGFHQKD